MEFEVNNIEEIVELIMKKMTEGDIASNNSKNGVFNNVDEAIDKAKKAQEILFSSKLEMREKIVTSIRDTLKNHTLELAELGVKETGMGRVGDKELKHKIVLEKTPGLEDLKAFAYSGDDGLTVMELSPYGVIGAITPSTNPSETIICNSIGMIAAGNAVIFAPHPGAKKTSIRTVKLINEAIKKVGGPDNLVVTIAEPSIENTEKIIANPNIKMLVATGGPGVVKTVMSSGKKAIGAGAGNPPVLVDETADIEKAAKDIVAGCSFDNNLPCIAEKEVVAVDSIVNYLIFEMQKNGAYLLKDKELIEKLLSMVLKNGSPDRKYVGKDAKYILKQIGIEVSDEIKVIILETSKEHPFAVTELLMPVLPIIRVKDALEGIKVAKDLEHGLRHTAMIHSKNIDILTKYAREMETTILVKNGPSYAGIGVGGEGHTTFTIAGPTGEGLTSAKSFARNRRCVLVGGFSIK
ncbi:aldehyde dehydrogenase EutE [Fusobacterium simiae]|uniref:aldehyde dehydrogenase family protein n=1 Tax=Fusobacterium TaxID=848 RepID=UPI00042342E7|nr:MULTISPECIES: aldehyde dehydrogenase family protein [Fusobacterium]MDC7954456.1 aldehyde dehydrogenase EutE [Fusobacterium simiae]